MCFVNLSWCSNKIVISGISAGLLDRRGLLLRDLLAGDGDVFIETIFSFVLLLSTSSALELSSLSSSEADLSRGTEDRSGVGDLTLLAGEEPAKAGSTYCLTEF